MHTEEEAKRKYCPMSPPVYTEGMCQARRCMMWRWIPNRERGQSPERLGYCGLAGKPEVTG